MHPAPRRVGTRELDQRKSRGHAAERTDQDGGRKEGASRKALKAAGGWLLQADAKVSSRQLLGHPGGGQAAPPAGGGAGPSQGALGSARRSVLRGLQLARHMCDARDGTRGAGIANGALDPGREQAIGVHRVAGDAVPERHLTALLCGDRREGTSHVDPSPQPSPRLRPAAPVTCWACKNPQGGRLGGPEGRGRGAGGEDARPSKQ